MAGKDNASGIDYVTSRASVEEAVGDLYAVHEQFIPDSYMDDLKREADDFAWHLAGYTKVATVPQALADKWLLEGFNVFEAPNREVIKRLKAEGYDKFVVSGSRRL